MRRPHGRYVMCLTLLALLFWPAALLAQGRITEPQAQALLEALDRAAASQNTDALMAHFSDDCIITLEIPGPDGAHRFRWSKEEYATQLEEGYEETEAYTVERTDTTIQIAPDGQSARVTATVTEAIRTQTHLIHAVTKDEARLELRDGKLVVTRLDGVVLEFERQEAVDAARA